MFVGRDGCEQDERRAARVEDLASARQIGFVGVDIVRAENDEVVVDLIRGGGDCVCETERLLLVCEFVQNNKREFAFVGELSAELDELTLSEGQGMNVFHPSQLRELLIRPDDKETLEQYFGV